MKGRKTKVIQLTVQVRVPQRASAAIVRAALANNWYGDIWLSIYEEERVGVPRLRPRFVGPARSVPDKTAAESPPLILGRLRIANATGRLVDQERDA